MVAGIDTSISTPSNQISQASTARVKAQVSDQERLRAPRQIDAVGGDDVPPSRPKSPTAVDGRPQELKQATAELQSFVQDISRSLQISVDEDLGDTVIRVLDRDTQELVRQIPAEEVLEIARYLKDRASDEAAADVGVLRGILLNRES